MALSLNIGSPAPSPVQNGTIIKSITPPGAGTVSATLPVPSTAGTCLILVISQASNTGAFSITSMPAGWTRLITVTESTNKAFYEVWIYQTNPGGISGISIGITSNSAFWFTHMSEWSNVVSTAVLEASGSTTSTSGTTLAPTTGSNVLTANDVAISGWIQRIAASSTVVFTTPGGWTRLADWGATSEAEHLDLEYKLNPATGATLGPTLSSDTTTTSAAGAIIVLKSAPPITDQSNYLLEGSLSLKLNTLDFTLIDCPTTIENQSGVTLSAPGDYPDWVGTITAVTGADVVQLNSGHHYQICVATNTQSPNFTNSPYDLSSSPATNTADFLLTQGGDFIQLQNGSGNLLLQSSVQEAGYSDLRITTQVGSVGPPVTLTSIGYVTVHAAQYTAAGVRLSPDAVGFWPGMTFKLTSNNLANWITAPGGLYTIATITVTYEGVPPIPVYEIQFGDRIQTLAEWTAAH